MIIAKSTLNGILKATTNVGLTSFKNNARIKESDLNLYLENVADILLENSEGYGIWTYRNYRANMIFNSQFALESEGWDSNGDVTFITEDDSNRCYIGLDSEISQNIPDIRNHFNNDTYTLSFDVVEVLSEGTVTVGVGDYAEEIFINKNTNIVIEVPKSEAFDLSIKTNNCIFEVDNLQLFSQVQEGYLYDEDNKELECIDGVRTLNCKLGE